MGGCEVTANLAGSKGNSLSTDTESVETFSFEFSLWISGKDVIEKNVQSTDGLQHDDSCRVGGDAEGTPTNSLVLPEPQPSLSDTPRTPGGTRESRDEFLERVMSLDPMEGKPIYS